PPSRSTLFPYTTLFRSAVLVLVDIVDRNLPARNSVAQVALSSVFPAVDVGVTILAGVADLGEDPLYVAFLAWHLRVPATERITRSEEHTSELRHVKISY